jgi:CheY-like chemotaxis protein
MNWIGLGETKILIADDDAFNRQLIIALLAKISNIKVIEASDGLDALKILRQESIDMLLLDYHMPRMNGDELLQEIKMCRELSKIPVAVITTDESEMRHLYELGADDFILKPFDFQKLRLCLYKHIKKDEDGSLCRV